jgi:hypothetical protein
MINGSEMKQCKQKFIFIMILFYNIMTVKPEDRESELKKQMFDEIIKMLSQKHIKLESIVQKMIEQGTIQQESFDRTYRLLMEYGKKRQWMQSQ